MARKSRRITINDLIIPIISFVVVGLLIFFVIMPAVKEIDKNIKELADIRGKKTELLDKARYLENLDQQKLSNASSIMLKSVPEDKEVAEIAEYVDKVAKKSSLKLDEISASNTISSENNVVSISIPITYSGSYENIISFLKVIQSKSLYAIDIQNLDMEKMTDNNWRIRITITMFQLKSDSSTKAISSVEKRERIYLPIDRFDSFEQTVNKIGALTESEE